MQFTPGSKEAYEHGCKCPIIDNDYGRGYLGSNDFVISGECKLHAKDFFKNEPAGDEEGPDNDQLSDVPAKQV